MGGFHRKPNLFLSWFFFLPFCFKLHGSELVCCKISTVWCCLIVDMGFGFRRLYFTKVKLGNPEREFNVQIDTGSDILWVTCSPCDGCPETSGLGVMFCFFTFLLLLSPIAFLIELKFIMARLMRKS